MHIQIVPWSIPASNLHVVRISFITRAPGHTVTWLWGFIFLLSSESAKRTKISSITEFRLERYDFIREYQYIKILLIISYGNKLECSLHAENTHLWKAYNLDKKAFHIPSPLTPGEQRIENDRLLRKLKAAINLAVYSEGKVHE